MANLNPDVERAGIEWSKSNTYEEKDITTSAAESLHDDLPPQSPTENTLARKLSARQVQMIAIGGE